MQGLLRSSGLDLVVVSCVEMVDSSSVSDAKLQVDSARDGTLCLNRCSVDMMYELNWLQYLGRVTPIPQCLRTNDKTEMDFMRSIKSRCALCVLWLAREALAWMDWPRSCLVRRLGKVIGMIHIDSYREVMKHTDSYKTSPKTKSTSNSHLSRSRI